MQTAAHIESALWHTVILIDGDNSEVANRYKGFAAIKRNTEKLIGAFKSSAERAPPFISLRINAVSRDVEDGITTRNIVAHGAFMRNELPEAAFVVHEYRKRDGSFCQIPHVLTMQDIRYYVAEANGLLENALQVQIMAQAWYDAGKP